MDVALLIKIGSDTLLPHLPPLPVPLPEGEGIICLFCCSWYSCPYIVQQHKTIETVANNVHSYLLSGTAVGQSTFSTDI